MSNLPTEANQYGCLTCPFCKGFESVQIQQVQVTTRAKRDFVVVCSHCDARGPWAYMKDFSDLLSLATLGSVRLFVSYRCTNNCGAFR